MFIAYNSNLNGVTRHVGIMTINVFLGTILDIKANPIADELFELGMFVMQVQVT